MKKLIFLIKNTKYILYSTIICFFFYCRFTQSKAEHHYNPYELKKAKHDFKFDTLNISESYYYWGDNSIFLFGKSSKLYKTGVGFILYDTITKTIKFNGIKIGGDEDFIIPYFFKTTDTLDPVLLLCNVGAEYSYGVRVYKIERNKIQEIGDMNIAADVNPSIESSNPIPFIEITTKNDSILFSFKKDIATDFQGENEKHRKAGRLKYIYTNNRLIEKIY